MKIYNFADLFKINFKNTKKFILNEKTFKTQDLITPKKQKVLDEYGVYFLFDKRVGYESKKRYLNQLIYIGQAGGNIQKNAKRGENFFDRIHKHWLKSIGAEKSSRPKEFKGISISAKWKLYRSQLSKGVKFKKNFSLIENHLNYKVGLVVLKSKTKEEKIKIKLFEDYSMYKFFIENGIYPICNSKPPSKETIRYFKSLLS